MLDCREGSGGVLTQRQNDILNLIVDWFIHYHEPVGSKALQEMITSSSATIRNDMAKLEQLGLLEKAHISSGRFPSRAGFQYFVTHSLDRELINEDDVYQVMKTFDFEAFRLEDILERANQLLAELTGFTSVLLDVEPKHQCLTSFDIVQISSHDALAVMTLDESKPVTIQFAIPKNFLSRDLLIFKQLVDERFCGQTVLDIHYRLRTEIPQVVQRYFTTTDNVLDLMDYIFDNLFQETVFISGKVASLNYAQLKTYQFLDDEQAVALSLRKELRETEPTKIWVGDHPESSLQDVSVIQHQFPIPYRGMAQLNLIGPIDMDYRRQMSLINIISRMLFMKLRDYYRYLNSNHYEVH